MGISKFVGLKATFLFCIFGYLRNLIIPIFSLPILHASLVSFLVSIAAHPSINLPLLLGKRPDGTFPLWSLILFGPFLFFVRFFVTLRRLRSREPPYSEIVEGVYVGGWPSSVDKLPPGDPAVIDCTCELPRTKAVANNAYLCVPTWDTRAPQPAEIESVVRWACRKRAQNRPVFVHCAFGHGRSVSVMCALLVALGKAEDWKSAEKIIRERRPCIRMNSLHRRHLDEWSKHRLSSQKNEDSDVSSVLLSSASESVWKALCIDFYSARESVKGKSESPDSVNPPTVNTPTGYEEEEEEGLPSPPLDDFGAFLGVGTNLMEVSKFFDGMDEDGNPRSNLEFDKIPENGRNRMPEKSNMDKEKNMEKRKPESRDVEIVPMKDKHVVKPDTVSKQNKAYNTQAGVGRSQNLGSEQKVNSETKLARSLDTTRMQHRPEHHAKSNFPGEVLDQKLEAAKKRLQENYQQAQNAKKQRTIQTLELSDLPKNGSGNSRSVHMRPGNHNRHRPNIRR